jgi:hypothetical protein
MGEERGGASAEPSCVGMETRRDRWALRSRGQVVVGSGSSKGARPALAQGPAGLDRFAGSRTGPPSQRLFAN